MNCGLMDDYSDSPDQLELESDMEVNNLDPQWLEDCNSLRESKPRCGICAGYHGPIGPLLNNSTCHQVNDSKCHHVSVETVNMEPIHNTDTNVENSSINTISDSITDLDHIIDPLMQKPFSNWYCVNNYLIPMHQAGNQGEVVERLRGTGCERR